MFIGLSSVCAIGSFGASLASNYKEPINCVSLNNQPCKAGPTVVKYKIWQNSFLSILLLVLIKVVEVLTLDNHMD